MQKELTTQEIIEILSKVTYKNWTLRVIEKGDAVLAQWIFMAPDNHNKAVMEEQRCRKWYISRFSTPSEVIRTAYLAVVAAEAHERDENFLVDGVEIFNPHTNLFHLTSYMLRAKDDVREPLKQNS